MLAAGCGGSSSSPSATTSGEPAQGTGGQTQAPGAGGLKKTTTPKYGAPAAGAPVLGGTVHVAYRNIAIYPGKLRVRVGTTVEWTNFDSVEHNVTSEGGPQQFASQNFGEGASYTVKLLKPGVIHYRCTIHPASMNGTIEVVK